MYYDEYENKAKHKYDFSIRGSASFIQNGNLGTITDDHQSEKAIILLNSKKSEIADQINSTLDRQLPASFGGNVKVITSLEFGQGSITWAGIIIILDWVGKIVDTVTFIQLTSSAIEFAVNKIISREASRNSIPIEHETIRTNVMPNFSPTNQTDFLVRDLILRQNEQVRILRDMSRNLDNLLRYIGQLQRKNSMFRLPNFFAQQPNYPNYSYPYPYTQRKWFSKDTLIVLILLFLTIIQIVNYFGLETITGWFASLSNLFKASP